MNKERYAIIVAGGRGLRMGGELPKQFLPLCGKPVLMRTLELFEGEVSRIILVLPEDHIPFWEELCQRYHFTLPHTVALGGETRFHSVRSGLSHLPQAGLVAVHDGVRPLASRALIRRSFEEAERSGAALPACPVTDSLRLRQDEGKSEAVDRSRYVAVQTPQTFDLGRLQQAYEQAYSPLFTDDASVYEAASLGIITLVAGEETNIKLTTPRDLLLAELLLREK
ncbi:2-C-methyl-D-erythritol 4-phosphate cytidylyltransferase [Porphyromonas sp. oral taxon 278 str. W7784]|jgi:2-C-methyl-D-erythritol 4-phosphate cytidylyltransferase|uniref:2-C-methyl-D-erythritol 4-phosphate cytidylyltransferase n=1 Tax=Porphyromonas sp. oral taxon 278 TaxID=712437 RepID=UPI0003AD34DF|nr:2-C-methyl-D-erythritol 4-phosphate cytidylyltransferase [Porphyromonas sp. oral taxon 278]ERJ71530.1 2-C-methyl-D-erythritol 4-phosphate cytidylyltransferase [Porphyromonas sp. oral taxon 278 str. W7784]